MRNIQNGFSLVEIAIVLIIIGLLLGGILKGQEIITQARIKNIINDLNGISVAVSTYQERYRRLPGDDDKSSSRWKVDDQPAKNGNGDGLVGSPAGAMLPFDSLVPDSEPRLFWQHLRLSGLLTGDGSSQDQPQNPFSGITGVQQGGLGVTGLVVCTSSLPGKVAAAIDMQIDDGDPVRGQVRSIEQNGTSAEVPLTHSSNQNTYDESGQTRYVLCRSLL